MKPFGVSKGICTEKGEEVVDTDLGRERDTQAQENGIGGGSISFPYYNKWIRLIPTDTQTILWDDRLEDPFGPEVYISEISSAE